MGTERQGITKDITEARGSFRETVDVIYGCWKDEPLPFKGDFIDVADLNVLPKPVQKPIPMHIAVSTSPESVDYAASKAMPIMVGGPTAVMGQVPQVLEMWHERMEHYGHPHEHIDLGVAQDVYVAPTMEEAERDIAGLEDVINAEFHRIGNPKSASGTPEVVGERIEVLRGLGINSIRCNFGKAGLDSGKMQRCMHMFAEEVMPHFT